MRPPLFFCRSACIRDARSHATVCIFVPSFFLRVLFSFLRPCAGSRWPAASQTFAQSRLACLGQRRVRDSALLNGERMLCTQTRPEWAKFLFCSSAIHRRTRGQMGGPDRCGGFMSESMGMFLATSGASRQDGAYHMLQVRYMRTNQFSQKVNVLFTIGSSINEFEPLAILLFFSSSQDKEIRRTGRV